MWCMEKLIYSNFIWNYIQYYEYKSSFHSNFLVFEFFFPFLTFFYLFYKESQMSTWQVVIDGTKYRKKEKKKKIDRGFIFRCCMHNCMDCIYLIHPPKENKIISIFIIPNWHLNSRIYSKNKLICFPFFCLVQAPKKIVHKRYIQHSK